MRGARAQFRGRTGHADGSREHVLPDVSEMERTAPNKSAEPAATGIAPER